MIALENQWKVPRTADEGWSSRGRGHRLMCEQELDKRTGGARSSLILIKCAASKIFAYQPMFPVERRTLGRMIYVPKSVAVDIVIGPVV